ncbi:MAG TPA: hypothetical protein P5119_03960 [Candidatus Aminicenantes bacterium]|nr:hypothetical protein [Candidatus Aminicenantes bacterium]HRY64479.1 hypothetical protein [Candidatus Aminicenantes bacterium]HRZ71392.1 hypothetical protein [Candidatus Aminicenantes bacterium]
MPDQFRDAEATFAGLRQRFQAQEITAQEFADSLRQLRIKDDDGRFWVIGAESGKWYAYENGEWIERRPPSLAEKKAICIACGFENDLEAEFCARCGRRPDDAPPDGLVPPDSPGADAAAAEAGPAPAGTPVTVRSVDILSFLWFFGVLGLFAGLVLGLLGGVTGLFASFVDRLPAFFVEHRGDLFGGLAGSFCGGLLGFVFGAAGGALAALVANGILSLVGGVRFRRS